MSSFEDSMKGFTENLAASIRDRGESLGRVREATEELLKEARGFLEGVTEAHAAMSHELHETMDSNRAARHEASAAMRDRHRDALTQMRDELNKTLTEANEARHDAVSRLQEAFQTDRRELANDLAAASKTWRSFAATR